MRPRLGWGRHSARACISGSTARCLRPQAEIRLAKALGGSMVGMSTVPEATAARHMGAQVLGISLCTNLAAGLSDQPLTHTEVIETAAAASERFSALFDELLPTL